MAIKFLNTVAVDTDVLYVDAASNEVGIGTTSPGSKLEVVEARSGSSASDQTHYTLVSKSTISSGTPGTGGIKVVYDDGSNEHAFGLVSGSSSADFLTSGPMNWYTNSDLNTHSATGFAMTIDTGQRVGIGTTSPTARLEVKQGTNNQVAFKAEDFFGYNVFNVKRSSNIVTAEFNDTNNDGADTFLRFKAQSLNTNTYIAQQNAEDDGNHRHTFDFALHGSNYLTIKYDEDHTNIREILAYERFKIVDDLEVTGNVGIGEHTPAERLHIAGSVDNDDVAIRIDNDSDDNSSSTPPSAAVLFNTASNNGYVRVFGAPADTAGNHKMDIGATASTSYLTFSPSGSEKMRITSTGNVGIGATNPSTLLQLSGTGGNASGLSFSNTSGEIVRQYFSDASADSDFFITYDGTGGAEITLQHDGDLILNGSNGDNVGIGTTTPAEKLEVSGGNIKITNTGTAKLILRGDSNNSGDSGNLDGIIDFIHDEGSYGYRLNTENHSGKNAFHIQDYQNSSYLSRIYIAQDGEVGIGTDSPAEKLVVSGTDDVSIRINSTKNGTWTTDQLLGAYEFFGNDASGGGAQIKAKIDCSSVNQYGAGFNMRFFTASGGVGTSASERMRIRSDGIVLIGKTTTGYNTQGIEFHGTGLGVFTRSGNVPLLVNRSSSDGTVVSIRNDNSQVGSISVSGTTTSFNTSSDYRLKENIIDLPNALDKVRQLQPKRFNFISKPELTVDGFLAHEVQNIIPEAVLGEKDAVDENGEPEYQEMDNSKIVPLLVGAIKELKAEIETLKSQINS